MRYVLPLRIFLNAVIKLRGAPGEINNHVSVRASLAFRVWVRVCDGLLNLGLEPGPFLVRRFALHPPEHYRDFTVCEPAKSFTRQVLDPAVKSPP
jgi:hypothetical protein